MLSLYLAGYDVFRRDAKAHGTYLKALCADQDMVGLYPIDNDMPNHETRQATAEHICQANMAMLRDCDGLLANLNPFRGHEPDAGTVFEVGMAVALGKPVWAYFTPSGTLRHQIPHDPEGYDRQGHFVEDFMLPMNLMLACTWAGHSASVEEAVPAFAAHLRKRAT